ncbi:MAG: four helix bundle protein [Candidatus Acidiferrales bacterium]
MSEKTKVGSYRDLLVWQKGMQLARAIYELTAKYPADERFGLVAQMRRAAVSVPSNISESQARHTTGEFVQFVSHAEGSVAELDTQLQLSEDLGYCRNGTAETARGLIQELRRMLNSLRRELLARR